MNSFQKTLDFNAKLKKVAHKKIEHFFNKTYNDDFIIENNNSLELDMQASIDCKAISKTSKVNFAVQEKYRTNENLKYMDFTQELYNAYGTENQSDGEFLHLYADYYFYGWSNKEETDFAECFMMDIKIYKILVHKAGGLWNIRNAKSVVNENYGKALFYTIPLAFISPAIKAHTSGLNYFFKK